MRCSTITKAEARCPPTTPHDHTSSSSCLPSRWRPIRSTCTNASAAVEPSPKRGPPPEHRTSQGTQTNLGSQEVADVLTVVQTCRLQARSALAMLEDIVRAAWTGVPMTSLLPQNLDELNGYDSLLYCLHLQYDRLLVVKLLQKLLNREARCAIRALSSFPGEVRQGLTTHSMSHSILPSLGLPTCLRRKFQRWQADTPVQTALTCSLNKATDE